ncbi:hypothetical protein GR140_32070 (plasmid) [Pseudomonas putida]|uniref:SprT family zinc-dependent metalloprotease n=1 Tax=Pseudomonas putida TaxID=303 RepID=UPI001BB06EBD|nr:SprT-like domain-containing protein [Pseudomonas putida]QUG93377.1 hypothetical protein GR140_32070 [Pseudomonas putida]
MRDYVRQVTEKVRDSLAIAERHFGRNFKLDDLLFDLKGRAAGMCVFSRITNTFKIRINRTLLEIAPAHVIDTTVPHEVAHLVAYQVYGMKIPPHGQEWQSVMVDVFGLQPGRCHQIDTSTASPRPFVYVCKCPKEFRLSKRMHNRQTTKKHTGKNKIYQCKRCLAALVFSHEVPVNSAVQSIRHLLVVAKGQPFSSEHAKLLRSLVKGFFVARLSIRHDGVRGKGLKSLLSILSLDEEDVSTEAIGHSLPGAVSHAVFFACPGDERMISAAQRLRAKSVVVRVLRHPEKA